MLYSVERRSESDELTLSGTPDEIIAVNDDLVDLFGGFQVIDSQPARHDGAPAVRLTLADSMGEREIGRVVIRTDLGFREERPEWTRFYLNRVDLEDFVREFESGEHVPSGYVASKARKLEPGQYIWLNGAETMVMREDGLEFVTGSDGVLWVRVELDNVWAPVSVAKEEADSVVERFLALDEVVWVRE